MSEQQSPRAESSAMADEGEDVGGGGMARGSDALQRNTGVGDEEFGDEFEEAIVGGESILHRQKITWPWYIYLLMLFATVGAGASVGGVALAEGTLQAWMVLAWIGVVLAFVWSLSALRIVVTRDKLHIKYGLLGPSIPIENITHCEAERYSVLRYGGWGIRYSIFDGSWAFNMNGDKGKAVRIHYKTPLGFERKMTISSLHHNVLADAINRARAAKGHDVPLVSRLSDDELGISSAGDILYDELMAADEVQREPGESEGGGTREGGAELGAALKSELAEERAGEAQRTAAEVEVATTRRNNR